MVLWGLRSLKERLEAPEYVKKQVEEERPGVRKQYSFFKLPEKWNEFCETVIKNGESGGAFLKTAKRVEIEKHNLILIVDSYFYEDWLKIPYQKHIKISRSMSTGYGDCCPYRRGHGAKEKDRRQVKTTIRR